MHRAEVEQRISGKGRRAIIGTRISSILLTNLLLAGEAWGDVVPNPRSARGGGVDPWLSLLVGFIVCAAVAWLLTAGWRAARRSGGMADGPEGEMVRNEERWLSWRGRFVILLLGIGFLVAVAIPNFLNFRVKAKTSEFKSNLGAIRSTEVAYFAEWNVYVGNIPFTPPIDPGNPKRFPASIPNTRFSLLGFAPEGAVYCSYAIDGPDFPTAAEGFTIRAVCDLDGDGELSTFTVTGTGHEIVHSGDDF